MMVRLFGESEVNSGTATERVAMAASRILREGVACLFLDINSRNGN